MINLLAEIFRVKLDLVDLLPNEEQQVQNLIKKISTSAISTTRTIEQIERDVRNSKRGDATIVTYLQSLNCTAFLNDEETSKDRSYDIGVDFPTYFDSKLSLGRSMRLEVKSHPMNSVRFSLRRSLDQETCCMLWSRFDAFLATKSDGHQLVPWFIAKPELFASVNRQVWSINKNGSGSFDPTTCPYVALIKV